MRSAGVAVGVGVVLLSRLAAADGTWRTFAHDFQRTARAPGVGAMHAPEAAWKRHLGGALGAGQVLVADVDKDGRPDVVHASGGRVVVSHHDGTVLWKTAFLGRPSVQGVWDLDGDGVCEVVIGAGAQTFVLSGQSGAVLTTLAMARPASSTFVPLAKGGMLVLGIGAGEISGFDFRGGTSVSAPAWTNVEETPMDRLVGDVDGDGKPELVVPLDRGFKVMDPVTGAAKYSLPEFAPWAYYFRFQLSDVDGKPGQEIVAVDESYMYSAPSGVYVLGVDAGKLAVRWSTVANNSLPLAGNHWTVAGSASDLDADGSQELVFSVWDGAAWATQVVDAATGVSIAKLPGEFLQAVADLDGDGKREIIVRDGVGADQRPPRTTLRCYDFDSRTTAPSAKAWTVSSARVVFVDSPRRPGPWAALSVPVTAPFAPGGTQILIARDSDGSKQDRELELLQGDGSVAATHQLANDQPASVLGWADAISAPSSKTDIVVHTAEGTARVLDKALSQVSTFKAGTFSDWTYAERVDQKIALFTATSNDHGLWIDGTHLDSTGLPKTLFEARAVVPTYPAAAGGYPGDPVKVLKGGTTPTIVTVQQEEAHQTLVGHDATGVEVWRTSLAAGSWIREPGSYIHDFTADGTEDLLLPVVNVNAMYSLAIYDGATGQLVRSTPISAVYANSDHLAVGALADVSGDSQLDLVVAVGNKGPVAIDLWKDPMAPIWPTPSGPVSAMVNGTMGAAALSEAGSVDVFRVGGHNAFGPYARFNLNGQVQASFDPGTPIAAGFDANAAALVERTPGTFDVVTAGTAYAAAGRLQRLHGATFAPVWTVYLAGGNVTNTVGASPPALHDPLEMDVNGDGKEDIVVGADDGWLYAVSATDGGKVFSLDLGAPVARVIAANVDLDPELEIVVSTTDGHLVAVDEPGKYLAERDPIDAGVGGSGGTAGSGGSGTGGTPGTGGTGTGGGGGDDGDGCSCRAAPSGTPLWLGLVAAAAGIGLGRRRRRS